MKLIRMIFISLICIFTLTGCSNGLNKYKRNGQYVELTYQEFDQKIIQKESFNFFLTRNGCPGCKSFYPVVEEFLKENEDKTIYTLNDSDLTETDRFIVASYYVDALGIKYFEGTDRNSLVLYTPSICKISNGESIYAQIGNLDKNVLENLYQDNYLVLNSFYMLNRKVQNKETFNIFISKNGDTHYDNSLRQYFINNSNQNGVYLDASKFDEEDNEKLLNRINYYLGEENEIETLPDYCLLQYEKGNLINFSSEKYDEVKLNALYNK